MKKANTCCYRGLIDGSGLTIPKLTRRSADVGTILILAAAQYSTLVAALDWTMEGAAQDDVTPE
jgi:hypothetical protein